MSRRNISHRCFRVALVLLLAIPFLTPADAGAKQRRNNGKQHRSAARAIHKNAPVVPFSTVVIDAGHGGFDPGGIRQNIIPEKDVALDVAKRIERSLSHSGLKTVMTRSDDRFIPLDSRVAIANAYRDAIFLCIHFNSATRRSARGVETYYAAPTEAALAGRIQRNLAATTSGDNRGVKRAGFRVLRNTRMRAVLAECGFLTNPQDVALASNPRYRQTIAEQISRAIVEERNSLRLAAQVSTN
ncbi:MAG: N-acetylmuramoyl-L-alanine amidase [Chthoniobacterales bacterium]